MPKAKAPDAEKRLTQLLDILRKALDGAPHRLQGTTGLFPGGQTGFILIQLARTEGLLQEVPSPEPSAAKKSKAKPPIYVTLTERGRQFVLDKDSPAKLLAGLGERLDAQGTALAAGLKDAQAQIVVLRDSVSQLEKTLGNSFGQYQQTVQAFRSILDRAGHQPAPAATPVRPAASPTTPAWLDQVIPFVGAQKRLNSFDRPNLKRVYEHLKQLYPTLTLGEFHDGLRSLHQQRRFRLDPYTQALATLQDPLHALYLDREVKYYVDLP